MKQDGKVEGTGLAVGEEESDEEGRNGHDISRVVLASVSLVQLSDDAEVRRREAGEVEEEEGVDLRTNREERGRRVVVAEEEVRGGP